MASACATRSRTSSRRRAAGSGGFRDARSTFATAPIASRAAGITHVLMHSAQHRAEAAELLTRLGYSPGQLDYMEFLDMRELDLPFFRSP